VADEPIAAWALESDSEDLYDNSPIGQLSTTPDGRIVRVNATFLTWTGYTRAELVGVRRFVDLLSPGGRLYHETHYAPLLQMQAAAREIAFEVVCADDSRLPVLVNAMVIHDHAGRATAIRVAILAATNRREYERELLRARRRAEESEARASLLARTLQSTLIPPAIAPIEGLDVGAIYRPAGTGEEVGGDFYDVFQIAVGDWAVVIGDVCGKGVDAAIVTALVRYTARAAIIEHAEPRRVLEIVNEVLMRNRTDRFCTVALLRLRQTTDGWRTTVALAGHPSPLLLRADVARAVEVGIGGQLLGIFPTVSVHDQDIDLGPGDRLVLYTDGVTEGRHGSDFYGEDRLDDIVASCRGPAQDTADRIAAHALAFQEGDPADDIAIVVVGVP
jgi:phosphoserine phosphatase RsbU/P